MNNEQKLLFLREIQSRKSILFAKFSNTITREKKISAWNDILYVLRSHNVPSSNEKNISYFRDVAWPNIKRYTIEKRDKKLKTGEAGGKKMKWTEVDLMVMDIIGEESPAVVGLDVAESTLGLLPDNVIDPQEPDDGKENQEVATTTGRMSKRKDEEKKREKFIEEFRIKKLRKIDLEIENLELRNAILRKQLENPVHRSDHFIEEDDFVYRRL